LAAATGTPPSSTFLRRWASFSSSESSLDAGIAGFAVEDESPLPPALAIEEDPAGLVIGGGLVRFVLEVTLLSTAVLAALDPSSSSHCRRAASFLARSSPFPAGTDAALLLTAAFAGLDSLLSHCRRAASFFARSSSFPEGTETLLALSLADSCSNFS
jgi:hypothetical protein